MPRYAIWYSPSAHSYTLGDATHPPVFADGTSVLEADARAVREVEAASFEDAQQMMSGLLNH